MKTTTCHTLDMIRERTQDVYAMQSEQQNHPTEGAQYNPQEEVMEHEEDMKEEVDI